MSEKISNLPVATDVIGADVPIVQGGVNKKAASTLFDKVYNANEIPFGDGATAGGITSTNFLWTEATKVFQVGDLVGTGIVFIINNTGNVFQLEDLTNNTGIRFGGVNSGGVGVVDGLMIDIFNDIKYLGNGNTFNGIFYAGVNSAGLGVVTGLGIDIKNDVYTLGNPLTSRIELGSGIGNNLYDQANVLAIAWNTGNRLINNAAGTTLINFTGTNLFIQGNEIDFSAANAPGYWKNDGTGVISYDNTIISGTYTPTLTGVLNVTATTARKCQWMRVGNVITVSGQFDVTPTANNSATKIGIELPVASVFTTAYECAGTGHCTETSANHHGASIYGDVANARAELSYFESHGTADTFTFTFTYEVI